MLDRKYRNALLVTAVIWVGATVWAGEPAGAAGVKLDKGKVTTERHVITVGANGLPEQIEIKALQTELPLEKRGKKAKAKPTAQEIKWLGRGPQLRKPLRLVARVGGTEKALEPTAKATPALKGTAVEAAAKLKSGSITADVKIAYAADGSMKLTVTYATGGQEVESLELVADLDGAFDTLIVGPPVEDKVRAYKPSEFEIPTQKGLVWGNAAKDAAKTGRATKGVPGQVFVGNGDRGFTVLTDGGKGWQVDANASCVTLERDEAGALTMRVKLVNKATKVAQPATASLAWLTHPASVRASGWRKAAWLSTDPVPVKEAVTFKPDLAGHAAQAGKAPKLLRADVASLAQGANRQVVLAGPAGGDALSAADNLVKTYPIGLFRYLSGSHTGMTARLLTNSKSLIRPGQSPSADRVALARALLHDIGIDAGGLAHLSEVARVVSALQAFGIFDDDQTEVIPYWRSRSLVRYGAPFDKGGAFELTKKDPNAQVYVTIYRRPVGAKKRGYKTMMIVANESDQDLRNRLFVLAPKRLFGGPNRQTLPVVRKGYDYGKLPPAADWASTKNQAGPRGLTHVLKDMEDQGAVAPQSAKGQKGEIYGPLHITAHSFRLVSAFGTGR